MAISKPDIWKGLRLAVVAFGFVSVFFAPSSESAWHISLLGVAVILSSFPALMLVAIGILLVLRGRNFSWKAPSWHANPFDFSHPEQFLHLGAWVMLAQGIATLIKTVVQSGVVSAASCAVLAAGAGIWIGLWGLTKVYRWQLRRTI